MCQQRWRLWRFALVGYLIVCFENNRNNKCGANYWFFGGSHVRMTEVVSRVSEEHERKCGQQLVMAWRKKRVGGVEQVRRTVD